MAGPNSPYTALDFSQVIRQSFDEANDRLRVDAVVTASIGEVKITDGTNDASLTNVSGKYGLDVNVLNDITLIVSHTDDSIRLGDGTVLFTGTTVGPKTGLDVNVINDLNVDIDGTTATPSSILLVGSEDGTTSGSKFIYTNNIKQQILSAKDVEEDLTWADFGTKNERITQIDYTSSTFSGSTARKSFTYSLAGTQYRLDNVTWSII
jgi:hypothetical protein